MSDCKNIDKILQRSGTDQVQRYIDHLDPANFQLHDFSIEDWILFAYNFASQINYFDVKNSKTASNNWQVFFEDLGLVGVVPQRKSRAYETLKNNITNKLNEYEEAGKLTPHLTLFVSFLKLLELSKERFNNLTKRHLDFYYKQILQVDNLDFTPDTAHVVFELAKKSVAAQIVENTALNAKKDKEGKQLTYKTNKELVVTKAKVSSLKSIYNSTEFKEFKASANSISLDGFEEPLPAEKPYWYPFAYTSNQENFIELPNASIGFALASPLFNLKDGLRNIEITINFEEKTNLTNFSVSEIINHFEIYGSGIEEWLTPINLLPIINNIEKKEESFITSVSSKQLKLALQLPKDMGALVNYDSEILLENHKTTLPLLRFIINTDKIDNNAVGHEIYQALIDKSITNISVKIDVKDVKAVIVENDFGVLKTKKPFHPFTSQPIKDSNFIISNNEVFSKNWKNFDINLKWKNIPDDFANLYDAYVDSDTTKPNPELFTAKNAVLYKEEWNTVETEQLLFSEIQAKTEDEQVTYESKISFTNANTFEIDKISAVKLTLNQSFLHQEYPNLYAKAIISIANTEITNLDIPNEPYTPLVEEITINYTAEETINLENTKSSFEANRIQLFHEHPFGQSQEHIYLKSLKATKDIVDINDNNAAIFLVPKYNLGEFFIGLENVNVLENVALLIQVLEGSENPLVNSFERNETINWSILCDNKWKNLKESILTNNTDNFLKSGIIKFNIPREATNTNSLLPKGYVWIKASMQKNYDAVCKAINVHAQAVEATFVNNDNELSHLENGLPSETIGKLITRVPQIKSVAQPYNSFNGIFKEQDDAFYRRISERLRHKNRAISLWDYEHLILQEFSEIYKVKCLNHTKGDNFIAAGNVTLVVIPDTVNKNVFDIYQPRVSKALLNKVTCFINKLNTMHVNAEIINPEYEEIEITLEAKFHIGYDENFYQKQLEQDIIKFLSPWAFDDTKAIVFGVELHQSVLIDYLEKLEYVDYLQNIEIRKDRALTAKNIKPTNPKSILVSAKKHNINSVIPICETLNEQEACQ